MVKDIQWLKDEVKKGERKHFGDFLKQPHDSLEERLSLGRSKGFEEVGHLIDEAPEEVTTVPQWVADTLEKEYLNPLGKANDILEKIKSDTRVVFSGNQKQYLQAIVTGKWEVEKPTEYVVSYKSKLHEETVYFANFTESMKDTYTFGQDGCPFKDATIVRKFKDKSNADALATLIDGEVEEL